MLPRIFYFDRLFLVARANYEDDGLIHKFGGRGTLVGNASNTDKTIDIVDGYFVQDVLMLGGGGETDSLLLAICRPSPFEKLISQDLSCICNPIVSAS